MHTAAVYTLLNNVHSIPTDCPTFEKNGWTGDAMLGTVSLTLIVLDFSIYLIIVNAVLGNVPGQP